MTETWIRRYYREDEVPAVLDILALYGAEAWHRETARVRRDLVILSRGSVDKLKAALNLAIQDYRDILIGEQVDPWVIGELKKYDSLDSCP